MLRTSTQAPIRQPTITVAAADSPARAKRAADRVCSGTDDQEEIQAAIDKATETGESVQLSSGEFVISDTILLKNGVHLVGQGISATTIKAAEGTLFPAVKIHDGVADARDRRAMITPVTRGDNGITEHIGAHRLTLDWNNCPADSRSPAPLWIDSCQHIHVSDIQVINAEPSDNVVGASWRGHAVSITQSQSVVLDRCELTSAHYRSLGVAYGASHVTFQNGVIRTSQIWRHSVEVHGGPGSKYPRVGPFRFLHNDVIYEAGAQETILTSHGGYGVTIRGNTFRVLSNGSDLKYVLKIMDGSNDNMVESNVFMLDGEYSDLFDIIALNDRPGGGQSPTRQARITGNYALLSPQSPVAPSKQMAFIHARQNNPHLGTTIRDNSLRVSNVSGDYWFASVTADKALIDGNVIENLSTIKGIRSTGSGAITIANNRATNPSGMAKAVSIESPADVASPVRIRDNDLGDDWTLDEEMSNVEASGNTGFETDSSAVAVIAAAETDAVVPHGLPGGQVASVLAAPSASIGDATQWWIEPVDADSFRVAVDQAPGGSGASFRWSAKKYLGIRPEEIARRYIAQVEAADEDALEQEVKDAITAMVSSLTFTGLYGLMRSMVVLAGPRTVAGCGVPLIGPAPVDINTFSAGDYNRVTGLKGDGSTKYFIIPIPQNQLSYIDLHNAIYLTEVHPAGSVAFYSGGPSTAAVRMSISRPTSGNRLLYSLSVSGSVTRTSDDVAATGFVGMSRSNENDIAIRSGGTQETVASAATDNLSSINTFYYRRATGAGPSTGRMALASFGRSVNLATLDTIQSEYMAAIASALS